MFSVITCIRDNHDWRLVLAAAAVCLVGAMAAMLLLSRAQNATPGGASSLDRRLGFRFRYRRMGNALHRDAGL